MCAGAPAAETYGQFGLLLQLLLKEASDFKSSQRMGLSAGVRAGTEPFVRAGRQGEVGHARVAALFFVGLESGKDVRFHRGTAHAVGPEKVGFRIAAPEGAEEILAGKAVGQKVDIFGNEVTLYKFPYAGFLCNSL